MYIHTDQCCNVKWQLANIFRSKPVTIIWALAYWSWDLKNLMFSWRWISEILACAWRLLYCLWCCSCGSQFGRAGYKTVINWCQVLSVLLHGGVGWSPVTWWGAPIPVCLLQERWERSDPNFCLPCEHLESAWLHNNIGKDKTLCHILL